ncbi:hypothetical protein Tco_0654036 [Tanacetum coccineum]|uniref:Uncharacterized protein n=1 Tax=Tanacetum coccineum TaxID=301880 RepID=A0ABQ4X226_9ASTR
MLKQEEIDKLVDGDEEEESYASTFADSVINNDDDDTGSKLEPEIHKEHPEHVSDDDEQKNDDVIEKEKEVVEIVKETNVDDEMMQKDEEKLMICRVVRRLGKSRRRHQLLLLLDPQGMIYLQIKTLADTVTPTTATSSKTPSTTTCQKKSFTAKIRRLPRGIASMCRRRGLIRSHIKTKFITREFFVEKIKEVIQHCDKIIPGLIVTTTNEMLKKEMPRLLIEELFRKHMQNTTQNLYPKTKSSTATTSSADLQQQLHNFAYHDDQHYDADPPEGGETWRKDIFKKKESFVNG